MGSENLGGDLTCEGYWGQLRKWGITLRHQVSDEAWIAVTRDGEPTRIESPDWMTPEERLAALAAIGDRLGLLDC
jgi:hypothetical protein